MKKEEEKNKKSRFELSKSKTWDFSKFKIYYAKNIPLVKAAYQY